LPALKRFGKRFKVSEEVEEAVQRHYRERNDWSESNQWHKPEMLIVERIHPVRGEKHQQPSKEKYCQIGIK
jgi:hypothetical protein